MGNLASSRANHGSVQILMFVPSPTRHTIPSFNKPTPFKMLLHVYETPGLDEASKIEQFGKYFAFSTLAL
jgi:hypothetical protein